MKDIRIIKWGSEDMHIALIAHDRKKQEIIRLASAYKNILSKHQLYATGTTGKRIIEETGLSLHRFRSGPLGGDQQIGAAISDNRMDLVIFLRDPLTSQAHEPDITALLRLCDVYEIPLATNLGTAEILLRGLDAGYLQWRDLRRGHPREDLD